MSCVNVFQLWVILYAIRNLQAIFSFKIFKSPDYFIFFSYYSIVFAEIAPIFSLPIDIWNP